LSLRVSIESIPSKKIVTNILPFLVEKDNRVKSDGNTALSNDISDNAVLEQGSRNTRKQVIVVASLLSFLLPATQYSRYQYYCPTARISIYLCC
jgi:hypothetical protein